MEQIHPRIYEAGDRGMVGSAILRTLQAQGQSNPQLAVPRVNQVIVDLSKERRGRDVSEAGSAIEYPRRQLEQTQLVDLQRMFYKLIESQTRTTMLADMLKHNVFRAKDPAVVPDTRSATRRSPIAVIGTMAGGMLTLMLVFVSRMFQKQGEIQARDFISDNT